MKLVAFRDVTDAYLASRNWNIATIGRVKFWADEFDRTPISGVTEDMVDAALTRLAVRGKMKCLRGREPMPTGQPLKGSTVNRYVTQLGSIFKFAKRLRLVPRSFNPPSRGIEKAPELADPNRFLTEDEVERIIAAAKVTDRHWKRLHVLIRFAFDTGLRVGNLMTMKWRDIDLDSRTATVQVTKNGHPHIAALSERLVAMLRALPSRHPDAFVFANKAGQPFHWRAAWKKACRTAGLEGRNFHQLRHGCGAALASAGVNQAGIMLHMGHRSLGASARYTHLSITDRMAIADRVFG